MSRTPLIACCVAPALVMALAGCEPRADLEPVHQSGMAAATEDVVQEQAGVRFTIDGDAWHGDPEVPRLVTPIQVAIRNESGKDLRIRYEDFGLFGAYDRYGVLPLFDFETDEGQVMLLEGYAPVAEPEFEYESFYVTDAYGTAFPELDTYPHALVLDDSYYAHYVAQAEQLPLPLVEMQKWAIPEGVLPSGSSLLGFLFFEGLHPGEERVTFFAQLEEAPSGDFFGAIQIPLESEGPLEP